MRLCSLRPLAYVVQGNIKDRILWGLWWMWSPRCLEAELAVCASGTSISSRRRAKSWPALLCLSLASTRQWLITPPHTHIFEVEVQPYLSHYMFELHQRHSVVRCLLGEVPERLFQELKHQTDVGTVFEVPHPSHNATPVRVQSSEVPQHVKLRIKSRLKRYFEMQNQMNN